MRLNYKTIYLIAIIFSLCHSVCLACSCSNYSPFLKSVKYSKAVIEGTVIEHRMIEPTLLSFGYYVVLFHIEKVYNGKIEKDTVLVAESRGFECYSSHFEDGKSYFVQGDFFPIHDIDSNGYVNMVNEVFIPKECAVSTILIGHNDVCGRLSLSPNSLNRWFYKLIGRISKFKIGNGFRYAECMALKKFRRKLENIKFKY